MKVIFSAVILSVVSSVAFAGMDYPLGDGGHAASVTWRIGIGDPQGGKDGDFDGMLEFFRRHRLTGKVSFFIAASHSVGPKIPVGTMDGFSSFHGCPYEEVFARLSRYGNDVYWRPGAGFYNDRTPDEALDKANTLACECAFLPAAVAKVEGEVENFNYQRLNKSVHMTSQEGLLYIAAGCRGVAWNVFPSPAFDGWETSGRLADALEAQRPLMDAAVLACGMARPRGVWNGCGRDLYVAFNRGKADWFDGDGIGRTEGSFLSSELQKIGIPAAYREEDCIVWAPTVQSVWSLGRESIERLLSGGVFLSAEAAAALIERGFGADIGFVPDGDESGFTDERLLEHPLNAGMVGMLRDGRKSFWGGTVTRLRPLAGAKVMSETVGSGRKPRRRACPGLLRTRAADASSSPATIRWNGFSTGMSPRA